MALLLLGLAPVLVILVYIYYRDKYEKEPLNLLMRGLIAGGGIVLPVVVVEFVLTKIGKPITGLYSAAYTAFVVAAFTEEFFKFLAVILLFWRNPNFNERFDGIVYAVFVSLGFALVENLLYVYQNGAGVGFLRAFTAVPAHAMFGVIMGYRLALAKFVNYKKSYNVILAFVLPLLFHGIYDFLLMSQKTYLLIFFVPLLVFMYYRANCRINETIKASIFKPTNTCF